MKKIWLLFGLVFVLAIPHYSVAQSTEDQIRTIGTGIGVLGKMIDNGINKRREREKREKEIDRIVREEHKQAEEAARERRMAAREAENAHNNERIRKLNAEDDTNKQAFLDGRVSYSSFNNWTRNLEFLDGFCNKVTFFSEEGEPLVFRVGFDADYCLCLEVSSENGIIENEQRINLNNTRMEFYGSWKGDDYRFMTDDGSFTIPANTNVYKQRLSRIFPKYSSRLRSFEMVNADDLKRGDLNKVNIMFRGVGISTKVVSPRSIAEKWVEYNKKTQILDFGTSSISFYEIDCAPNTIFLTLKIVEVDYLVFALRLEDPSSIKHRLSCDNVVIRYKTVYGEDVYRKTMLNLEVANHSNTYLLDNLFDLPEDAIDERTLTISFTGTKIKM